MSINQKGVEHGMCMDQFIGILLIAFQNLNAIVPHILELIELVFP